MKYTNTKNGAYQPLKKKKERKKKNKIFEKKNSQIMTITVKQTNINNEAYQLISMLIKTKRND
jgi:hypothetical protein